ncbi:DUF6470 family protein [Paenibacillus chungangensis]|uniref:DUF6470 family protein n=1 Tax=Paenibacillus chungangensis TaxID=696535 RepID=A0ABW3HK93_9BACL
MRIPQISIHSTSAEMGIKSKLGHFEIKQKQATIAIHSVDAVVSIQSEPAVVLIDLSKTWDALTGGKPIAFWNRIYGQSNKYVLDAIRHTVQEYNQIGDVLSDGNPLAEAAKQSLSRERPKLQVYGSASPANVDFKAVLSDPEIQVSRGYVNVDAKINRPQIAYQRGYVNTFMKKYPSVEVSVPKIDIKM